MDRNLGKNKVVLFITLFFAIAFYYISTSFAEDRLNLPQITAKEAIDLAEYYVKNNHIDISNKYVAAVAYFIINGDSYWRVGYRMVDLAKGGQTYVLVHQDKKVTVTYGE